MTEAILIEMTEAILKEMETATGQLCITGAPPAVPGSAASAPGTIPPPPGGDKGGMPPPPPMAPPKALQFPDADTNNGQPATPPGGDEGGMPPRPGLGGKPNAEEKDKNVNGEGKGKGRGKGKGKGKGDVGPANEPEDVFAAVRTGAKLKNTGGAVCPKYQTFENNKRKIEIRDASVCELLKGLKTIMEDAATLPLVITLCETLRKRLINEANTEDAARKLTADYNTEPGYDTIFNTLVKENGLARNWLSPPQNGPQQPQTYPEDALNAVKAAINDTTLENIKAAVDKDVLSKLPLPVKPEPMTDDAKKAFTEFPVFALYVKLGTWKPIKQRKAFQKSITDAYINEKHPLKISFFSAALASYKEYIGGGEWSSSYPDNNPFKGGLNDAGKRALQDAIRRYARHHKLHNKLQSTTAASLKQSVVEPRLIYAWRLDLAHKACTQHACMQDQILSAKCMQQALDLAEQDLSTLQQHKQYLEALPSHSILDLASTW